MRHDKENTDGRTIPSDGMKLTNILVVEDLDRAAAFYRDVPGADLTRECVASSVVRNQGLDWDLTPDVSVGAVRLVTGHVPPPDQALGGTLALLDMPR
jgi:catechol 2,3-dioxygenase-like lactoylglutathione lyase family enzyme